MHFMKRMGVALCATATVALVGAAGAQAANIAVLGDNRMDDFLTAQGHTTTLVTDAQVATPGFLTGFDVFVHTRPGFSFGSGLSAGAAAEVVAYAKRIVALNGDFADSLPGAQAADAQAEQVVANSATWASVGSGGVIGELTGAAGLLDSNSNGFTALGLITGSIGPVGCVFGGGGPFGTIDATPAGAAHPLLAGVALPDDPAGNDCGGQISGADSTQVLATYTSNGNPAVLARTVNNPPDCSGLTASPNVVWPPNGKFRTITVSGATDADGNSLTYTITNVMQDEPVNDLGDRSSSPDAQLLSGAKVNVRAERSGTGNGRVYEIAVSVADGEGGTCTGAVTVAVPHDEAGAPAINDGATYSSL